MRLAELCNGSTPDSDSVCEGSNPSSAAKEQSIHRVGCSFLRRDPAWLNFCSSDVNRRLLPSRSCLLYHTVVRKTEEVRIMEKACSAFALPTPEEARSHMELEIIRDFGSSAYGHPLYAWDDGKRMLARCRTDRKSVV